MILNHLETFLDVPSASQQQEVVREGGIWDTWKVVHDSILESDQSQQAATIDAEPCRQMTSGPKKGPFINVSLNRVNRENPMDK